MVARASNPKTQEAEAVRSLTSWSTGVHRKFQASQRYMMRAFTLIVIPVMNLSHLWLLSSQQHDQIEWSQAETQSCNNNSNANICSVLRMCQAIL